MVLTESFKHPGGRPTGVNYFPRLDQQLMELGSQRDDHGRFRYTTAQLADMLDVPHHTTARRLWQLGLSRPRSVESKYDAYRDEIDRLLHVRKEDGNLAYTVKQIATILGLPEDGVQKYYKQHRLGPHLPDGRSERGRYQLNPAQPKAPDPPRPLQTPTISLPPLPSLQMPWPRCMMRPVLVYHNGD